MPDPATETYTIENPYTRRRSQLEIEVPDKITPEMFKTFTDRYVIQSDSLDGIRANYDTIHQAAKNEDVDQSVRRLFVVILEQHQAADYYEFYQDAPPE